MFGKKTENEFLGWHGQGEAAGKSDSVMLCSFLYAPSFLPVQGRGKQGRLAMIYKRGEVLLHNTNSFI